MSPIRFANNMKQETYEDEVYYVCHDGREPRHIRTEKKKQDGYEQKRMQTPRVRRGL